MNQSLKELIKQSIG